MAANDPAHHDPDTIAEQWLQRLNVAEAAAMTCGRDLWRTAEVATHGIGSIRLSDGPHGVRGHYTTAFPTLSAAACSWNRELLERVGGAIAEQARMLGISLLLGPGVNIKRHPLCGRNFEYLSEDPHLAGELAVAFVEGVQGGGVGACPKHFAANNQETRRCVVDVRVSERALREIYLPAFETLVRRARPQALMAAYNGVNGHPCTENAWLLSSVLREEWGFEGVVISDWGAVYDKVPALGAGTDLEMPRPDSDRAAEAVAAVESGGLPEKVLRQRARAVLELVARGQQEPVGHARPVATSVDTALLHRHARLARQVAAENVVLLRNDGALLPLGTDARLAFIGPGLDQLPEQGGGSAAVRAFTTQPPLPAIVAAFPAATVSPGCDGDDWNRAFLLAEARRNAADADVTVLLLGLPDGAETEASDRPDLFLPPEQRELLASVAQVSRSLVVVLTCGSPVDVTDVLEHAGAIVLSGLNGQASGAALVDVLCGAVNPSGRLAETWPLRLEDTPAHGNFPGDDQVHYAEDVFVGYRWYDAEDRGVAFPFGHGLSYTTWEYSDLEVATSGTDEAWSARVAVTLRNTGHRDGAHVVQVYVRDVEASVPRPPRELRAFEKVWVAAGDECRVTLALARRDLAFWHPDREAWVVEPGTFEVGVGHSSRDIALTAPVELGARP